MKNRFENAKVRKGKPELFAKLNCFSLLVLPFAFLLNACGDEGEELYDLKKIRVPLVSFYQEKKESPSKQQGCERWKDGKEYCQAFPLYLGQKYKVKFLVLSPEKEKASLQITKMERYTSVAGGASRVSSFDNKANVELKEFGLSGKKDAVNSSVVSDKVMRIEEIIYDMSVPSLESLFQSGERTLPVYSMEYKAVSSSGGPTDLGFVTFFTFPELFYFVEKDSREKGGPAQCSSENKKECEKIAAICAKISEKTRCDRSFDSWVTLKKQFVDSKIITPEVFANLKRQARLNTPSAITSISPKNGSKTGLTFDLEAKLSADPDPQAKARLQWFVTKGKLRNESAKKTKWELKDAGPAAAVAVYRDLQGGVDYDYTIISGE
jgi:hypothetical protein